MCYIIEFIPKKKRYLETGKDQSKRGNSAHAGQDPYASLSPRRLPSLRWCPSSDGNVPGQRRVQILQLAAQTFHFLRL